MIKCPRVALKSQVSAEEFLGFQKHKHSRTCRKGGKPVCRFGIPFPPMRKTTIVGPYVEEDRSVYQNYYIRIQEHLTNLDTDITFDEFLKEGWII